MKSNQDLLNDKIKECICILSKINNKTFEENVKVFSKLYAKFLNSNRINIQESISRNIDAIDLFRECLLQSVKTK